MVNQKHVCAFVVVFDEQVNHVKQNTKKFKLFNLLQNMP